MPRNETIARHMISTFSWIRAGGVNWTVLLWAVGVPLPLVLIVALMRGCS